jgi:hypothetical protein
MKTIILLFLTLLAFLSLSAVAPEAQAVVPPPDGGYPGGNTAEGQAALLNLTTGGFNTALGFFSLRSNPSARSTPLWGRELFLPMRQTTTRQRARERF